MDKSKPKLEKPEFLFAICLVETFPVLSANSSKNYMQILPSVISFEYQDGREIHLVCHSHDNFIWLDILVDLSRFSNCAAREFKFV
jgi:hypothetical protein